ncbi:MAG: methyltransferase domain-containing protein [Candidatus Nitrohelix vancouverensis]|uniref:Methyltransferase domain-containing protein n=1 Tax=Candidatus Nitrohelix vancouverensis TaxID=2705534 RepID=A0A7T0C3I6_9BACT|nr:MAG: methyltransferase domain-containing protein [Candidatus Nitrohelix vancouverensis]
MKPINASSDLQEKIFESFSRRAESYDQYASIQKLMADRLASFLPHSTPASIVEIGCGTGFFSQHLFRLNPPRLTLNDLSPKMLEQVQKHPDFKKQTNCISGDAALTHFDPCDLVTGNAVFQWFSEPESPLKNFKSVLNPGGKILFNLFGPATLQEMRAVAGIDSPTTFHTLEQIKQSLYALGFKIDFAISELEETYFQNTQSLLKHLHSIGAAPIRKLSYSQMKRLIRDYDANFSTPKGVLARWEIVYFSAHLP